MNAYQFGTDASAIVDGSMLKPGSDGRLMYVVALFK